ncbi:hypothetical protein [Anaerotignum sp. MB30-C6]|uniref:hypothetical protein n=1 Tax=Anaerotignum sp. MB30-C6 TaxID=3070814 RepID=UPI0027DE394D|nr:hypothetical protein [Anaerotignum sp. MB30-C6]WMI82074.1 hypothetical protein RBQ60_04895 [Anaerotignum sp. MB30-C6]
MDIEKEEVEKVEIICEMARKKDERFKRREKRKFREYILFEICKMVFLLFVGIVAIAVVVPFSEAAPAEALLFYECVTVGGILVAVSFWLDKPRRKK